MLSFGVAGQIKAFGNFSLSTNKKLYDKKVCEMLTICVHTVIHYCPSVPFHRVRWVCSCIIKHVCNINFDEIWNTILDVYTCILCLHSNSSVSSLTWKDLFRLLRGVWALPPITGEGDLALNFLGDGLLLNIPYL